MYCRVCRLYIISRGIFATVGQPLNNFSEFSNPSVLMPEKEMKLIIAKFRNAFPPLAVITRDTYFVHCFPIFDILHPVNGILECISADGTAEEHILSLDHPVVIAPRCVAEGTAAIISFQSLSPSLVCCSDMYKNVLLTPGMLTALFPCLLSLLHICQLS